MKGMHRGMVEVWVTGVRVEQFINRASQAGIALENLKRHERTLRAWMGTKDALRLAPVVRGLGLKVRFGKRRGLPFIMKKMWGRGALGVGFAVGMLVLMMLSNQIWTISVEGVPEREQEIIKVLDEMGIRGGVSKIALNLRDVESQLIQRMPELSWAHCEMRGVRLIVRVVERIAPQPRVTQGAGDLVASRDAVVTAIHVYAGTPKVKVGQIVRAGQVLISGVDESGKGVQAMGKVEGRVWATGVAEESLSVKMETPTGRTAVKSMLSLGSYASLPLLDEKGFAQQQQEEARIPLIGMFFPVYLEKTTMLETRIWHDVRPYEDAKSQAEARAFEKAIANIPDEAAIVDKWVEYSMIKTGVVQAKYTFELTMAIAAPQAD